LYFLFSQCTASIKLFYFVTPDCLDGFLYYSEISSIFLFEVLYSTLNLKLFYFITLEIASCFSTLFWRSQAVFLCGIL
jgi:hypothetical protein